MAKINVESGGAAPLQTGELQLASGAAMSSTLTAVTDQANTASPLLLSTTAVQVVSPLRITTSDASGFYIDAEDSATNNRFSVKRDPSSQLVTIDFASNPTGSTTAVGAIRTYVDGVNLSEIMSFREDGNIGIGTTSPQQALDIFTTSTYQGILVRGNNAPSIGFVQTTGTTPSWKLGISGTIGNNLSISTGSSNADKMAFDTTGNVSIGNGGVTLSARLGIKGSGSTSATTSLLVQNSGGTQALKVADDTNVYVGGSNGGGLTIGNAVGGQAYYLFINSSLPGTGTRGGVSWNGVTSSIINRRKYSGGNDSTISIINAGTEFITIQQQTASGAYTNNVGINNTSPDASAILDVASITQGFLPPRMTEAQVLAIASPAIGLMAYNTDKDCPVFYSAAGWRKVSHSAM